MPASPRGRAYLEEEWGKWLRDDDSPLLSTRSRRRRQPARPIVRLLAQDPSAGRAAAARGMRLFRAYVHSDNRRMLDLITRFGDVHERKTDQGVTELLFTRRAERAGATR